MKKNGTSRIVVMMLLVSVMMFLVSCSRDNPDTDSKILKPKNAYSVAHNAVNVALKGDLAATMGLVEGQPELKDLDPKKKLFATMDFVNTINTQKLMWTGIKDVKLERDVDKDTVRGLQCFHGTFTYSGPMAGKWRAASGAAGTVKSCVAKVGDGTYVTEKLAFNVQDMGKKKDTVAKK